MQIEQSFWSNENQWDPKVVKLKNASLAMIFGALPLALSLGAASTSRIPLGIVIVGGVLFSLILSLLIVPVMYTFLSRRKPKPASAIEKLTE